MVETLGIMGMGWVKKEIMMALLCIKQIFIEHLLCIIQNYFPRSLSRGFRLPRMDDMPFTQFQCGGKFTELSFAVIIFIYS